MRAIAFERPGELRGLERPVPEPAPGQVLLKVHACGVCRTDLHLLDGEVTIDHPPRDPRPPDRRHRRRTAARRRAVARLDVRDLRVLHERAREPVPGRPLHRPRHRRRLRRVRRRRRALLLRDPRWLPRRSGRAAAVRRPDRLPRAALRRRRDDLGLYGFGAAAHIIAQVARPPGPARVRVRPRRARRAQVRARARRGVGRRLRRAPPEPLDAAIIFAPAGELVPTRARSAAARRHRGLRRHPHERHPGFPYELLWRERTLRSVANLTRARRRGVPAAGAAGPGHARASPRIRSSGPATRSRTSAPGASPARRSSLLSGAVVERVDVRPVLLVDDRALDLQRRRQLALLLREVAREDREALDLLDPRERWLTASMSFQTTSRTFSSFAIASGSAARRAARPASAPRPGRSSPARRGRSGGRRPRSPARSSASRAARSRASPARRSCPRR